MIIACAHCSALNRLPVERVREQPKCGRCQQSVLVGAPIVLDSSNFRAQVERSELPAIIDFWAPWCQPCVQFAPAYAQAAERLQGQLRLLKLDTQAHPGLAQGYSIRSIPTLVAIRAGRELGRVSGALPLRDFLDWATQWR